MEQGYNKEIEDFVNQFKCTRPFECCKPHFKVLCMATDIGLETFLKCLEEDPQSCPASVPFAGGYFCHCPLRVHIAKKFKK
jgi:hypothetical protein